MRDVTARHVGGQSFRDETLLWRCESQENRKTQLALEFQLPSLADEIVTIAVVRLF